MSNISKPLVIADYFNGAGEMAWAWWHEHHCRLAVIGDNTISPKRGMIKEIARVIHERDMESVYWITGEDVPSIGEVINIDAIPWVEQYPDPPKEVEDRNIFISNRNFFSAAFLRLLAKIKGVFRQDLMPPSTYRSHLEGPVSGHLRTIEGLVDGAKKEFLREQFKALESVNWFKTREEGRKYYIDKNGSLYEQALSFLMAVWSFWAHTAKCDDPQQFMLIIEPPKALLMYDTDKDIQEIVTEALRIMNYLTEVTTTSILLSSETLHPAPEQNFRYKLFFQTNDSDIDMWHKDVQMKIRKPELYAAWRDGMNDAGMWEDAASGERLFAFFRYKNIEFWDDFDKEED
ncbi:hypothetical protein ACFPOG_12575 [Paenibacillus aestuarii]|uniref:Uncharacterized protein n=1 Tax=Paenibacillus aestuarii TaxID=516965 RepID=A0ABW0K706_9BACL